MIKDNLATIHNRIKAAAAKAGRNPDEITLIAVSKRKPISLIDEALAAGQLDFGENYVQEAKEKIEELAGRGRFHFIGSLQSNKAGDAARLCHLIHTVDRLKLAKALDKHAAAAGKILAVLIQVNVGREVQKGGVLPEDAEQLARQMQELANLEIRGLMTMPPHRQNPEDVRPFFRKLRELGQNLQAKGLIDPKSRLELSMGMSGDFEVAIEEGATMVRVGTAIFGARE
ncbi:MAG: YggS family pyridoxal phosphate-dependent enzyme [Desulfobulbaceae bacterium]|nr:MAG: YggS family pyridoxal phosphate-dependent enzyme [Desulfobulbaceae bacterium]